MWVEERWRCIVRKILFVILISFLLIGCEKEPIKVGFIADISTKQSQLGVDARNSVELYLNKINLEGGIDGRMIDLIVKDDGSDSVKASEAHREFKDEGVYFVIGHLTSDMSDAVLNSQGEDLLFLSPSMSTDTLSENDDFFIRTSPINSRQGKIMSDYCHMNSIKDIVVIYDTSNEEYTKNLMDYFKEFYENDHFSLKAVIPFNSKEDDLENVANKVTQLDPSTVFMGGSSMIVGFQQTSSPFGPRNADIARRDAETGSISPPLVNSSRTAGSRPFHQSSSLPTASPRGHSSMYFVS